MLGLMSPVAASSSEMSESAATPPTWIGSAEVRLGWGRGLVFRLGGGEALALASFAPRGDVRRDECWESEVDDADGGVTMVGVGVLEGYVASILPMEDNGPFSCDIHLGHTLRSAIAT